MNRGLSALVVCILLAVPAVAAAKFWTDPQTGDVWTTDPQTCGPRVDGFGGSWVEILVWVNPATGAIWTTDPDAVGPKATGWGHSWTNINSSNARLSNLTMSAGEFDQIFQSSLTDYTTTASLLRSTTTVTPTPSDPNATITVNGAGVGTGVASDKITLSQGSNTITVVVTAGDGTTTTTYTVEVTRDTVASFAQRVYIKASNHTHGGGDPYGMGFGSSISLQRDTLAVGADWEDHLIFPDPNDISPEDAGAAYVYTQDPAGVWSQQGYLRGGGGSFAEFGRSIALDGATIAVGSGGQGEPVFIFIRAEDDVWMRQAQFKASNTNTNTDGRNSFGRSIALDGDTVVVGAPREASSATGIDGDQTDNSARGSGAVYVFTRDADGVWSQQTYIKASNTDPRDSFGGSIALDGDTLAVAAPGEESTATGIDGDQSINGPIDRGAGAVYVFD